MAVVVALAGLAAAAGPAGAAYEVERKWDAESPAGIALGPGGTVFVPADEGFDVLQKFTTEGALVARWGGGGTDPGRLDDPSGVAVDPQGNVYVADYGNERVQKFTADGDFISTWPTFGAAHDIALDAQGDVYVVDTSNDRILKFTADGAPILTWGASGVGDGQFAVPWGIAVDAQGFVYVSERDNNRIQKFTSAGAFVGKWGQYGRASGQFSFPDGIAVGPEGTIFVADGGNARIQEFTPAGAFLGAFGSDRADDPTRISEPWGVAVDALGSVYVASHNYLDTEIVKFRRTGSGGSPEGSRAKRLSLTATRRGDRVTLTAQLRPCGARRSTAGERVVFERKARRGWKRVGKPRRAAGKRCRAKLRTRPATRFRARSPRSDGYAAARSKAVSARGR